MFIHEADTAVILGAGFSCNAGLPMTNGISRSLFHPSFASPVDLIMTRAIKNFLSEVFAWKESQPVPTFEDIFTMIDLSSGSGHSLGLRFTPKRLRAIRRFLIYRLFRILDVDYNPSSGIQSFLDLKLQKPNKTHFVVLNWDIVLENHVYGIADGWVDYCSDITAWDGANKPSSPRTVAIAKVHGSSNWVYCDTCRSLFYEQHGKLSLTVRAGVDIEDCRLFQTDISQQEFNDSLGVTPGFRQCRFCGCAVGPHIATFSFKKSFRTHGFTSAWLAAEQILTQAKNWIFVGYSLPEADYEFKHLLKTCELKSKSEAAYPKRIEAVVLDDVTAESRYHTFFGESNARVFQRGLDEYNRELGIVT